MTSTPLVDHVLRRYSFQDAFELLSGVLDRTEITALMTAVFERRAESVTPAQLMQQMTTDRFVTPSSVPQRVFNRFDQLAFELLPDWTDLELSPVAPLGACSAVAPVDQKWVIATNRHQEIVSDCTNVLALQASARRKRHLREGNKHVHVRLCTSHRLTRTQPFVDPTHTAHFRVFTLVTAGRDAGAYRFETEALCEHINFYVELVERLAPSLSGHLRIRIFDYGNTGYDWESALDPGKNALEVERTTRNDWSYYAPVQFKIGVPIEGHITDLIDGGFVDWTQKILSDRKERMLISAIGSEIWCKCFDLPEHSGKSS